MHRETLSEALSVLNSEYKKGQYSVTGTLVREKIQKHWAFNEIDFHFLVCDICIASRWDYNKGMDVFIVRSTPNPPAPEKDKRRWYIMTNYKLDSYLTDTDFGSKKDAVEFANKKMKKGDWNCHGIWVVQGKPSKFRMVKTEELREVKYGRN